MGEGADDVRYDMEMTRQRMADTLTQIEARVSDTVDGVKSKLDVMQWVRDHPWPAVAVALAAGYALAASGADTAAAGAVADGAVSAAGSVKDAASGAVDRVRERFQGDDESTAEGAASEAEEPSWLDRIGARVAEEISDLLRGPSAELGRDLASRTSGRPKYSAPIDPNPLGSAGEARL